MNLVSISCVVVSLQLLCAPLSAQEKQDKKITEATTKKPLAKKLTPLEKLLAADEKGRESALVNFIEDQVSTNAYYAGQYTALKKVEGAAAFVARWIKAAPLSVFDETPFRSACVRALRDIHETKAPEAVVKDLLKIVQTQTEEGAVRQECVYALAQFGDRRFVDNMIAQLTKGTEKDDPAQKANAYATLAQVHYQVREYDKAVEAYQKLLALDESGKISLGQGLSITLYNAACSCALGGKIDLAFEYLGKALKSGTFSPRMLKEDMDIASLRKDPRFAALVSGKPPAQDAKKSDGPAKTDK